MSKRSNATALIELADGDLSSSLTAQLRLVGELLESALRQRAGEELSRLTVELVDLCRRAESGDEPRGRRGAAARIRELDEPEILAALRALTALFHLWNQAEKVEIARINRERSREEAPRPESIGEALAELAAAGAEPPELYSLAGALELLPTLTAHPTEARRPVVLHQQRRIAGLLAELAAPGPTPEERRRARRGLGHRIALLLATEEVAEERPSVRQEVEQGLYFLTGSIWEALPRIRADLDDGLGAHGCGGPAPFTLGYRSWVGGDRDGNPRVTAAVTRWTLGRHRREALRLHLGELEELEGELSLSERLVPLPDSLRESLERDAGELDLDAGERRRLAGEPLRLKVRFLRARLRRLLEGSEAGEAPDPEGFGSAAYRRDLELLAEAMAAAGLEAAAREGRLGRVRLLADAFGFHLAALDVRQHSRVHEEAVGELLRRAGVAEAYAELGEEERLELLGRELESPRPLLPRGGPALPEPAADLLETLDLLRDALAAEPASVGSYVVSMTHAVSDLLEVLLLAREVGLWSRDDGPSCPLDVVPLFETIDDLARAGERMDALLEHPVYRRQVAARGDFQEVMIGYSDSNKDGGYWMANWALHRAQEGLGRVCRRHDVDLRLFHGQGGTVGRGGGRASRAIRAQPAVVHNGRIRFTEQGEVVSFRYGMPELAHRHLEQVISALLRTTAAARREDAPSRVADADAELMGRLARRAMDAYRELLGSDDLWPWYRTVTPIEHISRLPIASRPVSRGSGSDVDFDSLRAIPWVFSWNQTRYLLPGWYGTGHALGALVREDGAAADLRRLYREWPFFATVVDNAQLEMARARLEISRHYAELAGEGGDPVHRRLEEDYRAGREAVLAVTGQEALLDNDPVIRTTIRVRNPYTDVLNLLQVELMRRHRECSDDERRRRLRRALFVSINGIAAAMQSTG